LYFTLVLQEVMQVLKCCSFYYAWEENFQNRILSFLDMLVVNLILLVVQRNYYLCIQNWLDFFVFYSLYYLETFVIL